jgi:L-seryl-tRNA(Ser) seleniumtransferase
MATPAIYQRLGLRRVINGAATLTRLGGSLMPLAVVEAMGEAAGSFIELNELQQAVGRRIAELTGNEAAFVTSGAAGGMVLATAACVAGTDPGRMARLPDTTGMKNEIIIHKSQRNGYDHAIRQVGVRLVEIGMGRSTAPWELEAAITERTAAVFVFGGQHFAEATIPLAEVVRIAHARDVPVIVDAAAQIPPIANLWHYTRELGCDLAIFSGGKGLCGPQASGLIVGRADLIEACRVNSSPNHSIGRPMKVGKEELVGLLTAIEWSLARDEPALLADYERQVAYLIERLQGLPGVTVERSWPSEAGQPMPRARVRLGPEAALDRLALVQALRAGDPIIEVALAPDGIYVNPQTLQPGEIELIGDALVAQLAPVAARR